MTTGLLTTTVGRNAIIADLGGGADLVLTHVAWGDANGVPYNPNEAQVALVNEKYRATIAGVAVVAGAIVVDAIIPADTNDGSGRPSHGFNVAEVGLFNNAGTLIGLARCGNGYKPPPSSGQAAAATYRLKLAVANPSAITVVIDPQAQIALGRHIRAPWLTVDGVLNDPPANPNQGDTYIIGTAPTGAWAGFANRIAQWVGVWSLSVAPIGHHVVDSSKGIDSGARWLERTATGWAPGVSRLIQKQPGNYVIAGGTANALTVTLDPQPASWAELIGLPLRLKIASTNTGGATLGVTGLAGTKPFARADSTALKSGDLFAGAILDAYYDGTNVQIAGLLTSLTPAQTLIRWSVPGSTTWTVPPGITSIKRVGVRGGGGAGGGVDGTANTAGAGGGGGGFVQDFNIAVTPGQVITVVVGAAGTNGGSTGIAGTAGGSSSFGTVTATGGGGGGAGTSGAISASSGAGGNGSGSSNAIVYRGQSGGTGFMATGGALSGIGGASSGGAPSGPNAQSDGTSNVTPGGGGAGGSGGSGARFGGNGANGEVWIEV